MILKSQKVMILIKWHKVINTSITKTVDVNIYNSSIIHIIGYNNVLYKWLTLMEKYCITIYMYCKECQLLCKFDGSVVFFVVQSPNIAA